MSVHETKEQPKKAKGHLKKTEINKIHKQVRPVYRGFKMCGTHTHTHTHTHTLARVCVCVCVSACWCA